MKGRAAPRARAECPHVSAQVMRVFAAYTRRYLRRRFHGMRILRSGLPPRDLAGPVVIYLNHAAWWDPLVCLLLSREYFAARSSFAPIDAAMLDRYGFFRHLGFFAVEQNTTRGARTFLETSRTLLASPGNALWITPQGRFVDVRERPLRLQEGLGALAARVPGVTFLPLAIEYPFWTEPQPELLVTFGQPIVSTSELSGGGAEWTQVFTSALEATQDILEAASQRRAPEEWVVLNHGKSRVSAVYDVWRRVRAGLRGERFAPEHQPEARQ